MTCAEDIEVLGSVCDHNNHLIMHLWLSPTGKELIAFLIIWSEGPLMVYIHT